MELDTTKLYWFNPQKLKPGSKLLGKALIIKGEKKITLRKEVSERWHQDLREAGHREISGFDYHEPRIIGYFFLVLKFKEGILDEEIKLSDHLFYFSCFVHKRCCPKHDRKEGEFCENDIIMPNVIYPNEIKGWGSFDEFE